MFCYQIIVDQCVIIFADRLFRKSCCLLKLQITDIKIIDGTQVQHQHDRKAENEQKAEAVKVVTALARFFRISLSKGKSIIPVRDELEHVRNYLMIQQMRFKNKFTYRIEAEPDTLHLASLKLMLQPLVENAIYHGMEFMDGDGEIEVRAFLENGDLWFTVSDNGLGMTQEQVDSLLKDTAHVSSKRGSGIGVKNVNERIRLYFGEQYGLFIESEPDEGTTIRIHLPAASCGETSSAVSGGTGRPDTAVKEKA